MYDQGTVCEMQMYQSVYKFTHLDLPFIFLLIHADHQLIIIKLLQSLQAGGGGIQTINEMH